MDLAALVVERNAIAFALDTCDRDGYPGSRAWRQERELIAMLSDFDAAHPEGLAEVNRLSREARGDSHAVDRALRGED